MAPNFKGRGAYRPGTKARAAFDAGCWEGYEAYQNVDVQDDEDRAEAAAEAESNARQYADHPTYELRSDAEWEAYEDGVSAGIDAARREDERSQKPPRNAAWCVVCVGAENNPTGPFRTRREARVVRRDLARQWPNHRYVVRRDPHFRKPEDSAEG